MTESQLFIGEDFSIAGQIIFREEDTSSSLDEFELTILLSTTPLGSQIHCSTLPGNHLPVVRREDNRFFVNIRGAETSQMSQGDLIVTTILTHKETGVRSIAEKRSVSVSMPKNNSAVWK